MERENDFKKGIFLFNKPRGISSAGFLNQIKDKLKPDKIGHGGTLDPLADGLLVTAISREYTKQLSDILKNSDKKYFARIILGYSSDTYDEGGDIVKNEVKKWPALLQIFEAVSILKGRDSQTPPKFSAVKIMGKNAYQLARKGKDFEMEPKKVRIIDYTILKVEYFKDRIILNILLNVSSGFYIRSFANDLGEILGTGGYIHSLTRYQIGDFKLSDSIKISDI